MQERRENRERGLILPRSAEETEDTMCEYIWIVIIREVWADWVPKCRYLLGLTGVYGEENT